MTDWFARPVLHVTDVEDLAPLLRHMRGQLSSNTPRWHTSRSFFCGFVNCGFARLLGESGLSQIHFLCSNPVQTGPCE